MALKCPAAICSADYREIYPDPNAVQILPGLMLAELEGTRAPAVLVGAGQQLRIGPFAPRQPCHGSPQALRQQEDAEENQVVHHHGEFSVVVPYLIIVPRLCRLFGGHGFLHGNPLFFFCHNRLLLSIRSEPKDSASQGQKQIYLRRRGRSPFPEKISKFRLRLWISILNH